MQLGHVEFACLSRRLVKGKRLGARFQSLSLSFVVVWALSSWLRAAPVEIYSSPAWVTGDGSAQVETIGLLKYAYSAGFYVAYGSTIDLNGKEGKVVTFKTTATGHAASTNALGTDIEFSPKITRAARDSTSYSPVTAITGNYRIALRDVYYVNSSPYSYTNTLKNLTPGRTYLIQVWASDGASASDREVKYSLSVGSSTNSFQLDINNGNLNKREGQVATFKAVAESSTMTLVLEAAGSAANFSCFSAIQVRDITPMCWSTVTGDWNTTGANWDPAEDAETVWGSTTGIGVTANFTNDAMVTLTSDVWARDVNVLSNTTIRRASSGTTTLTVMRNLQVDAERILTVGTGTANQTTALTVSDSVTGAGTVSIKNDSRVVLGKNAVGSANASIVGDGQDFRGAIQSIDNGNAEWSGQITCVNAGEVPRLGAGLNSVLTVSGKVTGNTLAIRSENEASPVGIVVLSNPSNDYTGGTTLYTPLRLGCDNAVPLSSGWTFASGVTNPSLDLNGYKQEIQSITGTTAGSNITNSNVSASVLTFNTLTDQSAASLQLIGNFAVVKKGPAKITLGMNNTYTGVTTIAAGTLALGAGGDIAQSPSIQIYTNATLDVTAKTGYTIQKKLLAAGGAINLGAGKTLSFASECVVEMPLPAGTPSGASLTVTGDVDVANMNLVLSNVDNFKYGQPYVILKTSTGTISNMPASVPSGFTVKRSADSQSLLLYRKGTVISFSI